MSLSMRNHIDSVFESDRVTRITKAGGYYDEYGIWVPAPEVTQSYRANVQPLNDKEIVSLGIGAERVGSVIKIYINNNVGSVSLADDWVVDGEKYKTIKTDLRKTRSYVKIIAERYDDQS